MAFYLGYFIIVVFVGFYMEKYIYKKGIILGLLLYVIGVLFFILVVKMFIFVFFLLVFYVIVSGLVFLEIVVNFYVIILGLKENVIQCFNFVQFFNGVVLVVGFYLVGMFIFFGNEGDMAMQEVKVQAVNVVVVFYVGIVIVVFIVVFLIWCI